MTVEVYQADCLEWMRSRETDSVDLVLGSPPYEAARTYGIDFKLKGQDWVDWMVERMAEMVRISRGLVAMVVEGQTRQFAWTATPALLMADLHRKGIYLRKPPVFHRVGIPGSGGPDWLRNDYEFIVCCSKGRKLPWSDNTAMGHPPKWAPGGEMSNRVQNGSRRNKLGRDQSTGNRDANGNRKPQMEYAEIVPCGGCGEADPEKRCVGCLHDFGVKPPAGKNQWGHSINSGATVQEEGGVVRSRGRRPSHVTADRLHTKTKVDGTMEIQGYSVPVLANPGNVLKYNVGGGVMGSKLAHENEAPYPEKLAEFFVRSFCPPNGIVYDPFSGSGTTGAAALKSGRNYIGTDIRESQVDLTKRRLAEVQPELIH